MHLRTKELNQREFLHHLSLKRRNHKRKLLKLVNPSFFVLKNYPNHILKFT